VLESSIQSGHVYHQVFNIAYMNQANTISHSTLCTVHYY